MVSSVMMPLPLVEETIAVLGLPRHHWCWRSRRTTALEGSHSPVAADLVVETLACELDDLGDVRVHLHPLLQQIWWSYVIRQEAGRERLTEETPVGRGSMCGGGGLKGWRGVLREQTLQVHHALDHGSIVVAADAGSSLPRCSSPTTPAASLEQRILEEEDPAAASSTSIEGEDPAAWLGAVRLEPVAEEGEKQEGCRACG
jgi:hypothetical protein